MSVLYVFTESAADMLKLVKGLKCEPICVSRTFSFFRKTTIERCSFN